MRVIGTGNLDYFDKSKDVLCKSGSDFTVRGGGMSKKIILGDGNNAMYFSETKLKGAFLCSMVIKDIDKYLLTNKPPFRPDKFYSIQHINTSIIKKNINKRDIKAIDINYCYWQTAYNLGFISERTFERGIVSKDLKQGRLAAIGSLNKKDTIEFYENGRFLRSKVDIQRYNRYSPFYWRIIAEAWYMMESLIELMPNDLYLYMTDCAYVSENKEKEVRKFFSKNGYKSKSSSVWFKAVDEEKKIISWWDDKDMRDKSITYFENQ